MFFYASKLIGALLWPSSIILMLLLAGTAMLVSGRWPRLGRMLCVAGVGLLCLCGFAPLGNLMMHPLEQRFARGAVPERIAGIIMLGGFEDPAVSRARGQLSMNEGSERLTEALLVAIARPSARVIFTGGSGSILAERTDAAGPVADYLVATGIARDRIVLEALSRTTHENAVNLAGMIAPKPGERYVLVTSAFHMPRAVGTFRRNGFDVVPWPVDFRTLGGTLPLTPMSSWTGGIERVDLAFKEWLGLLAYSLTDRTDALWPGPHLGDGQPAAQPRSGSGSGPRPAH